jgi:hypothetical protein
MRIADELRHNILIICPHSVKTPLNAVVFLFENLKGKTFSAVGGEVRPKMGRKPNLRHSPVITSGKLQANVRSFPNVHLA